MFLRTSDGQTQTFRGRLSRRWIHKSVQKTECEMGGDASDEKPRREADSLSNIFTNVLRFGEVPLLYSILLYNLRDKETTTRFSNS